MVGLAAVVLLFAGLGPLRAGGRDGLAVWVDANLMLVDLAAHHVDLSLYLGWEVNAPAARANTARRFGAAARAYRDEIAKGHLFASSPAVAQAARKVLTDLEGLTQLLQQTNASPGTISNSLATAFAAVPELVDRTEALHTLEPQAFEATAPPVEGSVANNLFEDYAELVIGCTPITIMEERLKAFESIIEATDNPHLQHLCLLNMAHTAFDADAWKQRKRSSDSFIAYRQAGLGYLEHTVQSDRYSPVLLECWINWRARTQEEKHGMSNWSEIPNHLYNSRRRQLANVVLAHVKRHPNDAWALRQLYGLCIRPNYERGGPFGHTGIFEIAEASEPGRREQVPMER